MISPNNRHLIFFHFEGWSVSFKSSVFLSSENTTCSKLISFVSPYPSIIPRHSCVVAWDRTLLLSSCLSEEEISPISPVASPIPSYALFSLEKEYRPLSLACSMTLSIEFIEEISQSLWRPQFLNFEHFYLLLPIFHIRPDFFKELILSGPMRSI